MYSDKIDAVTLRKKAFELKEDLTLVKGVSLVEVIGGLKREFQIALDPVKLKESKTTLNEIEQVSLVEQLTYIYLQHQLFLNAVSLKTRHLIQLIV